MASLPSPKMSENIRQHAIAKAAAASPKKRALVDAWIDASHRFEADGSHILADKAAFNAAMIASGTATMSSLPISVCESWGK